MRLTAKAVVIAFRMAVRPFLWLPDSVVGKAQLERERRRHWSM
jgi:hypothetical protein